MGLWTRKSLSDLINDSENGNHRLHRTLGAFDLILFGIGAIIGAGLFSITGIAAADHAGPAIVISFMIAAIGCVFAGLCYSELASMIPVAGSAYTFTYATMGEFAAWIIGWTLVLEYAIGAATVSVSWSGYIISLLEDLNIYLPTSLTASPWQPVTLADGTQSYGWINLPAFIIVALLTLLLIIGIRKSSIVNNIIVAIKISVVLVFIAVGLFFINPDNYHPFIPPNTGTFGEFGWSGIVRAAGIVFFAYIGFDAVSTVSQETKDPKTQIPIGILGSLLICTVLFVIFSFVMTGMVNYKDLGVAAPVAVAINQTPFLWLNWLVKLAILASFTSVILVMLLGQSRIFYSMSRDGLLPHFFSDIHPKFLTPWRSSILLMFFVGSLGALAPMSMLGHMTSIGTLLAFTIVCAGVLILRYRHPEYPRAFRTPWVPFVPLAGMGSCGMLMLFLGLENWLRLIGWLVIGLIVYFFYSRHHVKV